MVAAFGNLQIRVMARGEFDSLRRNQIDIGVVRLRQVLVHRLHHAFGVVRAGDREHRGMHLGDDALFRAEAASDHHFAVLGERFADGIERFLDCGFQQHHRLMLVEQHELRIDVRLNRKLMQQP